MSPWAAALLLAVLAGLTDSDVVRAVPVGRPLATAPPAAQAGPPSRISGPDLVAPAPAPLIAAPTDAAGAAAAPQIILYQGRLTDTSGAPRTGTASLVFALYGDATGGAALWNEAHTAVPLTDGSFSLFLGSINSFPVNAWSLGERYLGISVDGQGEMIPRLRLASVPFALEATRLGGRTAADFEPAGAAAIAAAGVQSQLQGSDGNPPNQGSNQVSWNNLYGVPTGLADGVDEGVTAHSQLNGLELNDHPQYALGAVLQATDGSPPNLGSNRVHWDNLGAVPAPLVAGKLPRGWLEDAAVDSSKVANGGLAARNIRAGSITADRLAPGAIGSAQIADASLPATKLVPSSVTGTQIQNGSVAGVDIQDESVTSNDIANGTILGLDMAVGTVTGTQVQDGTLTGNDLQDASLSGADLADSTLTGTKLLAATITRREIAPASINSAAVIDSSLQAVDFRDAPGVAFKNIPGFVDTVETQTAKVITTLSLTAPGPGYVQVTLGVQVSLLHQSATSTIKVGISRDFALGDSLAATMSLPDSYPTGFYQFPLQVQAVFELPNAGLYTFYVLGLKGTQSRIPSLTNLRLQAAYFPRRY